MRIMLATMCLNEMQWLPFLFKQHKDWPGLVSWTFVEGADFVYASANPALVSPAGLSTDGTSEWLAELAAAHPGLVTYIPYGLARNDDPSIGKVALRHAYMEVAARVKPDAMVMLDADEFYTYRDQAKVNGVFAGHPSIDSFIFLRREIWRPPALENDPLMTWEVTGGFWNIPCCHWWRWHPGMGYTNCHNTPTAPGRLLHINRLDLRSDPDAPQMVHLGFASILTYRHAKNRYYAQRGEASDPMRQWYVKSRRMFNIWRPGMPLPRGAKVSAYNGPVPEVFAATA